MSLTHSLQTAYTGGSNGQVTANKNSTGSVECSFAEDLAGSGTVTVTLPATLAGAASLFIYASGSCTLTTKDASSTSKDTIGLGADECIAWRALTSGQLVCPLNSTVTKFSFVAGSSSISVKGSVLYT